MKIEKFKENVLKPLMECYGAQKFPKARNDALWKRFQKMPHELYSEITNKIILTHDIFPGVSKIIECSAQVFWEYTKQREQDIKKNFSCRICNSQGVLTVNNFAYRCSCKLGQACYPAFAEYSGEKEIREKKEIDSEGNYKFYNSVMQSFVPKNCKDIRQVKTVIFNLDRVVKVKENETIKKIDF